MKTRIAKFLSALCFASSVTAAEPKFPADLHVNPDKFCFVAGVISAGIMERLKVGYNPEYVYEEVSRIDHKLLRIYLNETVTLAQQFSMHSRDPVPPKDFAEWNYQRCLRAMGTKA